MICFFPRWPLAILMTHIYRNKHTHTHNHTSVKSVLGTANCVWVPEMSGSWLCWFRLLLPLPIASIFPTFHSQQQFFASEVTISHNSLTMQYCLQYTTTGVKSKWFQTNVDNSLSCCSNNNFHPVQVVLLSSSFQLSHVVAFWLIEMKLVFMNNPAFPCLFALCCVLTINLVPGRAVAFKAFDTFCFVNASVHVKVCAHVGHTCGYMVICIWVTNSHKTELPI